MTLLQLNQLFEKLTENAGPMALRLVQAALVLLIGLWVVKLFISFLTRILTLRNVEPSLRVFLRQVVRFLLLFILIVIVAAQLGLETTSLVTALGGAALAIGLALQGSLSNIAGGVLILVFKPFKVGDYIEAQGHKGTVKEIQILYTILDTLDNRKVVIPNGNLSNNDVVNYSAYPTRRLEFEFHLRSLSNVPRALQLMRQVAEANPNILHEPALRTGIKSIVNSDVVLYLWAWVNVADMLEVQHTVYLEVLNAFTAEEVRFFNPAFEGEQ